jgi:hypothetical protein
MKGKVIRGKGFRGALEYLLAKLKEAEIVAGNLLGRTPWTLSREFAVVRQILPDCEKPVLHIPLRLPPGDSLANTVWTQIALRYFELMELSTDRPWILIRHDEHVHLLTSRISYAGDLWYGKWEGLNHINATQILEREFNLTPTPGLEGANAKRPRLTSGQLAKIKDEGETPEIPGKTYIAESIEAALALSDGTMDSFKHHLKIHGVTTQINQGKTSLVTGISYKFGEIKIKGSKVGRAYSWKNLLKLLEERKKKHELERDTQENARTSSRSNPAPAAASPASPTGPATARTVGRGTQNRGVADHIPAAGEAIPAKVASIPDDRTHRDHPDLRAHGTGILSATQVEPDAIAIEHPVPPASPIGPVEREAESTGRGHNQDLQLVEEACPSLPAPIAPGLPELTGADAPEEDIPGLEPVPPPPELSR